MQETSKRSEMVPVSNLHLDSDVYRVIAMSSYAEDTPVAKTINDMLRKQLAIQGFLKNGFQLFHKDIVKILADAVSDEQLIEQARSFPTLPEEMVILNVNGVNPDLKKYMRSFASFMLVNGYAVEIHENENEGTVSFYTRHGISHKYSLFWGEIIKMTLANLAEITREEFTDTSVYLECRVLTTAKHKP